MSFFDRETGYSQLTPENEMIMVQFHDRISAFKVSAVSSIFYAEELGADGNHQAEIMKLQDALEWIKLEIERLDHTYNILGETP